MLKYYERVIEFVYIYSCMIYDVYIDIEGKQEKFFYFIHVYELTSICECY